MLTWVIQKYLSNNDSVRLVNACEDNHSPYIEVDISAGINWPTTETPMMFYGGLELTKQAYASRKWTPGVVLNENFDLEVWTKQWGGYCLNYGAQILTVRSFCNTFSVSPDVKLFIRPCLDDKTFTGSVMRVGDFLNWAYVYSTIDPSIKDIRVAVTSPKPIAEEWRIFIVNKKVSTGSLYQRNGQSERTCELPTDLVGYAQRIASIWSPAPIFTLDIARTAERWFVVECGSFNSAGFYGSDVNKLVYDINNIYEVI